MLYLTKSHVITQTKQVISILAIASILYFCCLGSVNATVTTYRVGVVPQFPAQKIQAIWTPILSELERLTGLKFKLVGSSTIPAFESQFIAEEFDLAYMNPYHVLKAGESHQYTPLVRDTGRQLFGIIVVKRDSDITSVAQLNNKVVAFPSPNAVGASLIPRADFKNIFKIDVKPKYVQTHSSVYLNVAMGRVAAGGGVQKTLNQQDIAIQNKLKIIYQTKKFPPHPIVAHKRIPMTDLEKIKKALLELGTTEHGKALLSHIPITKIGAAQLSDYLPLKEFNLDEFYVGQ